MLKQVCPLGWIAGVGIMFKAQLERQLEEIVKPVGATGEEQVLLLTRLVEVCAMTKALQEADIHVVGCGSLEQCCRLARQGAGALVLTQEVLEPQQLPALVELLEEQPSWSDLAVLVVAGHAESRGVGAQALEALEGRVTVVEWPVEVTTLLGFVRVALGARRRQYQMRALMEALATSQRELEAVVEHLPAGIWFTREAECRAVMGNKIGCEMLGLNAGTVLALNNGGQSAGFEFWRNGERLPLTEWPLWQAAHGHKLIEVELQVVLPGRDSLWVLVNAVPLLTAEGLPQGGVAMFVDVTDRRRAEAARAWLAAVVENSGDAIVGKDLDGRITSWNPAAERMFGWSAAEAIGKPITIIFPPERLEEELSLLEHVRRGGGVEGLETVRITRDGRRLQVLVSVTPIRNAAGQVMGVSKVIHDITFQKLAEGELRRAKHEWERTFDSVPDLIAVLDEHGQFRRVNQALARKLGVPPEACVGLSCPGCIEKLPHPAEVCPHSPMGAGEKCHAGELFEAMHRGDFLVTTTPLIDEFDRSMGTVYMARDISERRRIEEALGRTVQERTAELRELVAELQHMSYSMVHDMRAPLRAMHNYATLLGMQAASRLEQQDKDFLERITSACNRLDGLVTDALNYNKVLRQEIKLAPVNTDALLRGILSTYPAFQAPEAEVLLDGDFPPALANASALTQCISQFLDNAVKFAKPGQVARVRIWAEARPQPHAGKSVRLWFEDNGVGIAAEALPKLFRMFQQMHVGYKGTGTGLAIVRKLVERMGGRVGAESEEGKGSRFWLELPAVDGS